MQPLADVWVHEGLVRAIGEARGIAVREDGDDSGRAFGRRGLEGRDAPLRHRAPHDGAMSHASDVELGGVRRSAHHFLSAVDAADWLSDERGGHARAPAVSTARTMARCMSSILKSL